MKIYLRVGDLLRERERTPYWLSKRAGITAARAYELAKGDAVEGMSFEMISRVAHALEVEPGDLFTWADEPAKERAA